MREKIVYELKTARKALGCIYVNDKQNCMNMAGALDIIDRTIENLEKCEVYQKESENKKE